MVRVLGVLITIGLLWASPSAATPQSVDLSFSDTILGNIDNPDYVVNSSVNFSWDDAATCSPFCELTITLTAETTTSGVAPSQGEVLGALVFDVLGGADFRDGPPGTGPFGGSVLASALVGDDSGGIDLDISAHWGLNPAIVVAGHGSLALSSVGDLFGGAATMGFLMLFATMPNSVEPMPPDGSPFGIIDANSSPSSGGMGWPTAGSLAYVRDTITATLLYTGTLTGFENVEPLYGTDGLQLVPEPSTALLLGAGLLGLAVAGRRRKA